MQSTTFRDWLITQNLRNDPIGDLARDVMDDECSRYSTGDKSLMAHVFKVHGLDNDVYKAFKAAQKEWREK